MDINKQQVDEFIDNIVNAESAAPTMFYAFCSECQDLRLFEMGQCKICNTIWHPLFRYMNGEKPMTP
jgi:hypothetical protein